MPHPFPTRRSSDLIDALCVEEDTGTRTIQILRDLTADVAQIEIGRAGVAHVDRAFTAKVDMHMRQLAVPLELRIALRCGRVEQTQIGRASCRERVCQTV